MFLFSKEKPLIKEMRDHFLFHTEKFQLKRITFLIKSSVWIKMSVEQCLRILQTYLKTKRNSWSYWSIFCWKGYTGWCEELQESDCNSIFLQCTTGICRRVKWFGQDECESLFNWLRHLINNITETWRNSEVWWWILWFLHIIQLCRGRWRQQINKI